MEDLHRNIIEEQIRHSYDLIYSKLLSERTPVDTAVRHIHLLRTESTNTYLRELLSKSPDLEAFTVITAHDQTAGRGQKGESLGE